MQIKESSKADIEKAGYGITDYFGGVPKQTYYTPDGRMIIAIPQMREFNRQKGGRVVGSGTRDANLDKGWLLSKPTVLKPYCKGCDRWHDTQDEVTTCVKKQKIYLDRMNQLAKKELVKDQQAKDSTIENLSKEVNELKDMVKKLLEVKK
jgi:hypothetical protein